MPVSGIALTLHEDPTLARQAMTDLRADARVALGDGHGRWLPVVVETTDSRAARDAHTWIESLPGVVYADVVYVGFPEPEDDPPRPAAKTRSLSRHE
jgi:nitrate reductase NapAB chaperone NapD